MSIHITVDIDGKIGVSDKLSPKIVGAIEGSIQTSLAIVKDRWQQLVQQKLNSARPLYLMGLNFDSIVYPYEETFSGAVILRGKLPNMFEQGFPNFDMKVGFGKSGKITRTKSGGWYLTIPFRHSTPGAFMYGQAMGKDVYGVAKKLNPYGSGQGNTSLSWPGAGDKSWTGYQHKTNKYNGMVRIVKSYQKATQSQYMTFRRVSNNSDPQSWMHPGYAGVHAAEKLMPFAEKTFVDILTNNLNGIK